MKCKNKSQLDVLFNKLKRIERDKQTISNMDLSIKTKISCYNDLNNSMLEIKTKMHEVIDNLFI